MRRMLFGLGAGLGFSVPAVFAHGFDERYDLPVPLGYFVLGAAAVVALSFLIAVLFARQAARPDENPRCLPIPQPLLTMLWHGCRAIALALFLLTLTAALWGTGDPMMNLAPTLVWIIWWVGLSLLAALVGNVWPALDPWRTLFDGLDGVARRLGRRDGIAFYWRWPSRLGVWPAVALLLLWSWLEVVYPIAAVPRRLGVMMLAWTALSLCGMLCFGRTVWQKNGDVFAIYFATLGSMAPLAISTTAPQGLLLRRPGAALMAPEGPTPLPAGSVAFVIAMLSTVLFDGLHGGSAWSLFERILTQRFPQWMDVNGYFQGSAGLICVWLIFLLAYGLTCLATARITRAGSAALIARRFVPTLVPIAVAYNIAHNFSSLLIQGQNAIPLISDPLGRHWDLFGTARRYADIGLIDARGTWYVAIVSIVLGHVISVWLAHQVALRHNVTQRNAGMAALPLTCLMIAYTAISLSVIAEPMVTF